MNCGLVDVVSAIAVSGGESPPKSAIKLLPTSDVAHALLQLPYIKHGIYAVPESSLIIHYLRSTFPDKALVEPQDPREVRAPRSAPSPAHISTSQPSHAVDGHQALLVMGPDCTLDFI